MYNIVVLNIIPAFSCLFERIQTSGYNARRVPDDLVVLKVPKVATERARCSIVYWGPKLWNSIPPQTRRCTSVHSFNASYLLYLKSCLPNISVDIYDILDFV